MKSKEAGYFFCKLLINIIKHNSNSDFDVIFRYISINNFLGKTKRITKYFEIFILIKRSTKPTVN